MATPKARPSQGFSKIDSTLLPGSAEVLVMLVTSFNALDADGLAMVEKETPVEGVKVNGSSGGYDLAIVSSCPRGAAALGSWAIS